MGAEPDYSRAALARFIEFVVAKNLVHPATAQGWRVATTKVLEELPVEAQADVRRIDVEGTFRGFLNRNPGRLSPASVGEYRRRVGRAIEEFVRWVEDPGGYAFRGAPRPARAEARRRPELPGPPEAGGPANGAAPAASDYRPNRAAGGSPAAPTAGSSAATAGSVEGIALQYPIRRDLLAHVVVPRDLTVEEARRMGAFLVTLAVDFKPAPAGEP